MSDEGEGQYDLPPRSPVHDGMISARIAGYGWSDIHEHIASQYDAGSSREGLGFAPVNPFMDRTSAVIQREMQMAAAPGNDNSPFAWTKGRAPVTEGGSAAAGSYTSVTPSSVGVQPATKVGPTTTGGPGWKAQSGEIISGNMGKATEADKYNTAVMQQNVANPE